VKLVMTLVVRDEADIVDTQIAYHLNAGVDLVLATDHDSQDGTAEILEGYVRQGVLHLRRERGEMRESDWRSRMARAAATEHGADWILNTDADEFWMSRRGTLKEALGAVPERFGIVWALTRHFVPRPDDGAFFGERMTARYSGTAPLNDPTSPYRPHAKAAHRADPSVVVLFGSHDVRSRLRPLRGWHPADVLHFPFRSEAQWERKGVRRAQGDKPLGQYVRAYEASAGGRSSDLYGSFVVDDETLSRGIAQGSLVLDTRLRDTLRGAEGGRPSPRAVDERAIAAAESSALREANVVRACRRLDVLAARLDGLEDRPRRVVARRLRQPAHDGGKTGAS
jgi:Glycosyl transferase family 2